MDRTEKLFLKCKLIIYFGRSHLGPSIHSKALNIIHYQKRAFTLFITLKPSSVGWNEELDVYRAVWNFISDYYSINWCWSIFGWVWVYRVTHLSMDSVGSMLPLKIHQPIINSRIIMTIKIRYKWCSWHECWTCNNTLIYLRLPQRWQKPACDLSVYPSHKRQHFIYVFHTPFTLGRR